MCWFSFQTSYGFLLVLFSLTKEPDQFRAALSDQPCEQLWREDLGPRESPLQRLQIPVRERLWKLWCRVVSTGGPCGSCTVRVTLPCIWQGACFCKLGCFLSGSQLLKWEECCPRWHLSCRCQSTSKAAGFLSQISAWCFARTTVPKLPRMLSPAAQ